MEHLAALADALERERRALSAEHQQLRALSLPARAAAGFTLYPLDLLATEHRSKGRVNVLLRGKDLHDGIQAGDPVLLAPIGSPDVGVAGRCEGIDTSTVELRVESAPEGKGPWALSRRLDTGILDLQKAALARAERQWSALKNLLLGYEKPYRPDPLDSPCFADLNEPQRQAAALALGATEIGLVHGPPGTGKTQVLVAMLRALRDQGERAWALAESNAAVDHLALRASAAGLDVVRLGVSARIGSSAAHLTLEHRILHGARAHVIQGLRRQELKASGLELDEVRQAIREEWSAAKREIMDSADVVAMTLGTLHTRGEGLKPPRTAVLDEAGQISEPSIWLLATLVKRLVLAGDPHQLGPVVKSRDPLLEKSLLAKLVEMGFVFPMLTEQHRMNEAVMGLCQHTYGGRLTAPEGVLARRLTDLGNVAEGDWTWPPARFLDTVGMGLDDARDELGSWYNVGEVRLVQKVWASLKACGVHADAVGVVTPYTAQVARLRAALPGIEVSTVNAFQGREKDVILASFVRSNPDQELGFVADPHRLNVTLTRARRLFVGIGDSGTLGVSPHFGRLLDDVGGGYVSGWELAD